MLEMEKTQQASEIDRWLDLNGKFQRKIAEISGMKLLIDSGKFHGTTARRGMPANA
jgi:DNA-binding GntR family transcriptional regulator